DQAGGVDDRDGDPAGFGGGEDRLDLVEGSAHPLDPAGGDQAHVDAVGPVPDIRRRAVDARDVTGEVVVRRPRAAAVRPEAEAPVLLVRFDLAVGADDLVFLVDVAFEVGRIDPVVLEVNAHPVVPVHAHLDS